MKNFNLDDEKMEILYTNVAMTADHVILHENIKDSNLVVIRVIEILEEKRVVTNSLEAFIAGCFFNQHIAESAARKRQVNIQVIDLSEQDCGNPDCPIHGTEAAKNKRKVHFS